MTDYDELCARLYAQPLNSDEALRLVLPAADAIRELRERAERAEADRDRLLALLADIRLQLAEGRLDHDWLVVSNVECVVDAALREGK